MEIVKLWQHWWKVLGHNGGGNGGCHFVVVIMTMVELEGIVSYSIGDCAVSGGRGSTGVVIDGDDNNDWK